MGLFLRRLVVTHPLSQHTPRLPPPLPKSSAARDMRGTVPTVRLGIVSTVRRMPDDEWFEHHRRVGVLRFYLNMPRSTAGARAAHAAAGDVSVMERAPDGGYAYDFWHRQAEHVDAFLARAQGDGVTHLLHIDDDELLYLPRGYGPFARCLDSLTVHCAVVRNWEAVAPHPFVTSPVRECFLFRRDPAHFTAYANGKAIACMRHFPDVRADGAHRFAGDRHEVSPSTAVILHYESVRVADWSRKFEQYAAAPSAVEPPFRFYRESIAAFRDGGGDAIGVWRRHKMATAPGESVVHVHPSFTAPSILLVGNGPSLRGSRLGAVVDCFPVVVRLNDYRLTEDVGERTTIWCLSDHSAVTLRLPPKPHVQETLCLIAPSPHAHPRAAVAEALRGHRNVVVDDAPPLRYADASSWPSTGLLALAHLLRRYPDSPVFVCGFDHFAAPGGGHYYDDACASSHAHAGERDAFERLARESGRVARLPTYRPALPSLDEGYPGLRLLHAEPNLFAVDGFLTSAECEALVRRARGRCRASTTVGESDQRRSMTYDVPDGEGAVLLERASALTGMPVGHMERAQVTHYSTREMYYRRHLDAPDPDTPEGRAFCASSGNREVTVLVYLNDVAEGGETVFDFHRVRPVAGKAIVFFPSTNGVRDERLYHAAAPTPHEKWVAQVWIRQRPYGARGAANRTP